ncbi:SS1, partial [Symbiodinium sp. KB8]
DVKKEALSLACPPPQAEGYESSGTQTPKTKAVSDGSSSESGGGSEQMERVFSLSALDALLQDPLEKADLRSHLQSEQLDKRPKYTSQNLDTPIVVVSSEVNPWSKTGGLAMVAGSYGYEFAMRGHRTMVVSPRYGDYKDAVYVGYAKIWLDGREHEVRFFHLYQDLGEGKGTDYIFVEHESYHRGGLYCDRDGKEYVDNLFRYALLTVAAMEAPLVLTLRGSTYGQNVLFIANDWQTGLLPVYHLYKYRRNRTYLNSRCVFVIHNIGYQGKYRLSKFPLDSYLGLPPEAIDLLQGEDLNLGVDCMNLMSAAILASDRVLTVSPNYAVEVQSPEGGQGLHEILTEKGRQMRMAGILNGIADEWDPRTDPHIPRNYGLSDFLEGKMHCKSDLQRSLGLHEDPGAALFGFCGRLCFQKGVHLITQVIPWLLTYENSGVLGRVQVILMGKGDDMYASQLSNAENTNRGRVCGYVGFDPKVEHRMMAGCDFLLMPSQYEPCGLPQMYAQAYGTVPVVHETGGLKDSVLGLWDEERDRRTATGFLFSGFEENNFKERLYQALEVYHKKQDLFRQIQQNGPSLRHQAGTRWNMRPSTPALIIGGWHPDTEADKVIDHANKLIRQVRNANVTISTRLSGEPSKLFLNVSQPPEKRRKVQVAAKCERLLMELGALSSDVETEYSTGQVWFKAKKVASATNHMAPQGTTQTGSEGWIDLQTIAAKLHRNLEAVQSAWQPLGAVLR